MQYHLNPVISRQIKLFLNTIKFNFKLAQSTLFIPYAKFRKLMEQRPLL